MAELTGLVAASLIAERVARGIADGASVFPVFSIGAEASPGKITLKGGRLRPSPSATRPEGAPLTVIFSTARGCPARRTGQPVLAGAGRRGSRAVLDKTAPVSGTHVAREAADQSRAPAANRATQSLNRLSKSAPGRIRTRDPLLRRWFQAGSRPVRAQVRGRSRCPWVPAGDRRFPPVLARTWHGCGPV
jgi:hypothetical protein